ncbi:hypothetical protein DFJ74DRAFT_713563 [Hyaloraphidium curvatum]|nr:hypothetical protein DFJ74DRAFT_713563 [Hyaloraphidium curvatum]
MAAPTAPQRQQQPSASAAYLIPLLPPQVAAVAFPRGADWSASPVPAGLSSAACFAHAVANSERRPLKPSMGTLPMLGFATMFGAAAYVLARSDTDNGASTATAWSLTYSLLNFVPSLRAWRTNKLAAAIAFLPWTNLFVYGTRTAAYHLG